MRIYSMTATFGKLEHETLTLKPGLNVIHAPNEWGKSTWCAFLVAMLYGLDTRAKSTKTALADKERYAPWSGMPMAGRMDIHWQGRDITLERTTKGRVPMGEFRAYETATGIAVVELNAANCGQMLLGVERSVFLRSGFVRLSDLPVTNDEALRRRLNALVTTGDESSAGDRLAKGLKDMKNRIRYNRTGLLPQLEGEYMQTAEKLAEIQALKERVEVLRRHTESQKQWLEKLENHSLALQYAQAETDARRVAEARDRRDEAGRRLQELDMLCGELPDREQLQWGLEKLDQLERELAVLDIESQFSQGEILMPQPPSFAGAETPEELCRRTVADAQQYKKLRQKKPWLLIVGLLMAAVGGLYWQRMPGMIAIMLGGAVMLEGIIAAVIRRSDLRKLIQFYGSAAPEGWVAAAENYKTAWEQAEAKRKHRLMLQQDWENRYRELEEKIFSMTQGKGLVACRKEWTHALVCRESLANARRDWQWAENQLETLKAMARTATPPRFPDELTLSEEETQRMISDGRGELRQLESRISQYTGRMDGLGDPVLLKNQLEAMRIRCKKLEDTYAALTVAQEALVQAKQELQRRFAPRIAKRARELMVKMTDGRYNRLQLGEDFSLLAGAEREDTLHDAIWRSEGTLDQLYLALRLAVAEALAPDAPLILDDALVRFDDDRLKAALEILREEAESKQVILFTCQTREQNMM